MAKAPPNTPKFSEQLSLKEILALDMTAAEGNSVRVLGKLVRHDFVRCRSLIAHSQSGCQLNMNTQLVEPVAIPICSLVQCIGEMDCLAEGYSHLLHVRVMRPMDKVDPILYERLVLAQRQYFEERLRSDNMETNSK